MENNYTPFVNSKFIVGRGSIDFIGQLKVKQAVVIYSRTVTTQEVKEKIEKLVQKNGGKCDFILSVSNEPYLSDIQKAKEQMELLKPDLIIAIGGGSIIDTAKAVHFFYEHPEISVEESLIPYSLPTLGEKAIMVAIPTTSGTGTETTSAAVFIDEKTKVKRLMLSNELIPKYAILDANFTDTLPVGIVTNTGMDALTHALEASVCISASKMVVSTALGAAIDILENLENSVSENISINKKNDAREICHVAASLAGVAITNSCAGLAHGFDQPGPYFGLPHGLVCGVLLPYTTAFACPHDSYVSIGKRLGLRGESDKETCQNLVDYLIEFNEKMGIPKSFIDLGVKEDEFLSQIDTFANLAISAVATKQSPKIPTMGEAKQLLMNAYYGKNPLVI